MNPKVLESTLSQHLKSHSPPLPKERKATQLRMWRKRKKQVTLQLTDQKKIDDDLGPKGMEHTTSHYNSSQPQVVLKRLKPEVLKYLCNHDKSNRYPTADGLPILPHVEKKETEPQNRIEKPVAMRNINGRSFLASEDSVHQTTCHYSSSQPRVVLSRLKLEALQSLSDRNKNSRYPTAYLPASPHVEEKESESQCGVEKPVPQNSTNNHNLPTSSHVEEKESEPQSGMEKPVSQSSINDHDLPASSYVEEKESEQQNGVEKPVPQSSINDHDLLTSSHVEEKESEPQSGVEKPVSQSSINSHNLPASGDDVHHTNYYSTSQPVVALTRLTTKLLDSLSSNSSPNSSECLQAHFLPCPAQQTETEKNLKREGPAVQSEPQKMIDCISLSSSSSSEKEDDEYEGDKRKDVLDHSSEEDVGYSDESDSSCKSRKSIASKRKGVSSRVNTKLHDSESDEGLSRWGKCLRPRRPPPQPVLETESSPEPEPQPREKRNVRLVAQKKINYRDLSDEEDDIYKSRRRTVRGDSSFSDDSSSLDEERKKPNRKRYGRKKDSELELRKAAMKDVKLSEYEKQRMKNIEEKLAFLESLKALDEGGFGEL